MTRRTPTLALLALVAALVSGCVGIRSDKAAQLGTIGKTVRVVTQTCFDAGFPSTPPVVVDGEDQCPATVASLEGEQVLVAYRVPAGTTGPATIAGAAKKADGASVPVTFRRSAAYATALADLVKGEDHEEYAKAGTTWIGYIGEPVGDAATGDVTITADLEAPASTPFEHLTVVGHRVLEGEGDGVVGADRAAARRAVARGTVRGVTTREFDRAVRLGGIPYLDDEGLTPDRALDCDESREVGISIIGLPAQDRLGFVEDVPTTECITDPDKPKATTTELRDLTVAGGEGFAEQGSTASVPFTLKTTGPAAAEPVAKLAATTALTGATAVPAVAETALPAGDLGRTVDVAVPATAAPGTYDVVLTATVGDAVRTATGKVVVLPKPAAPPAPAPIVRDNLYMGADGSIAFGWVCPPLCGDLQADVLTTKAGIAPRATTAAAQKPRLLRVGRQDFKAASGKRTRAKVKLYPKAQGALKKGKALKALVVVRQGGEGVPVVRRVVLKRSR